METWGHERYCPDCERPLRRLDPPECLADMVMPMYQCAECIAYADRFGETVECRKLFFEGEDGNMQVAPEVTQWLLADE